MNELSPLALRVAGRIVQEAGIGAEHESEIAQLIQNELREYRPIRAYASSLKDTLRRVIDADDPQKELMEIANQVGIPISFK